MEEGDKQETEKNNDSTGKHFTVEEYEELKRQFNEGSFDPRGNNPRKHEQIDTSIRNLLRKMRRTLIEDGLLEGTEEEMVTIELDKLYPNTQSRKIVEYNGKQYIIRYFPIEKSNSGKTVYQWSHRWEPYQEKPKK